MSDIEGDVQREAVEKLRGMGHTCWTTSTNKKSRCTPGTPDVFVAVGNGRAVCLEFKRPKGGKYSDVQKMQVRLGLVVPVKSVEEAIAAVREVREKTTGQK